MFSMHFHCQHCINTANLPQVLSSTVFCNYCSNITSAVIACTVWICFSVLCAGTKLIFFLWIKMESGAYLNISFRIAFSHFSIIRGIYKSFCTDGRSFRALNLCSTSRCVADMFGLIKAPLYSLLMLVSVLPRHQTLDFSFIILSFVASLSIFVLFLLSFTMPKALCVLRLKLILCLLIDILPFVLQLAPTLSSKFLAKHFYFCVWKLLIKKPFFFFLRTWWKHLFNLSVWQHLYSLIFKGHFQKLMSMRFFKWTVHYTKS